MTATLPRTIAPLLLAATVTLAGCSSTATEAKSTTNTTASSAITSSSAAATSPVATTATTAPSSATTSSSSAAKFSLGADGLPADLPADVRAHTAAGQQAFARYFAESINTAFMTPQPGLVAALSGPKCLACEDMERSVAAMAAQGAHMVTPMITTDAVSAPTVVSARVSQVVVHLTSTKSPVLSKESGLRTLPAPEMAKATMTMKLMQVPGGYKVLEYRMAPAS